MCRIQGAAEDFRNEIRIVLSDFKYGEQLNALCQNISQNKKNTRPGKFRASDQGKCRNHEGPE